jgi:hypothetical protein
LAAFCRGCKKVPQGEYHRLEGGKWGYINKTGDIVLNPEYDKAGSFIDGQTEVVKGEQKVVLFRDDIRE